MTKRRARWWLFAAVGALAVAAGLWLLLSAPREALAPPAPTQALLRAAQGLDDVSIDATFDPTQRTLTVSQRLTLVNRTGAAQRLLVLRAWANAFRTQDVSPAATDELFDACYPEGFSPGGVTLHTLTVTLQGGQAQSVPAAGGNDIEAVSAAGGSDAQAMPAAGGSDAQAVPAAGGDDAQAVLPAEVSDAQTVPYTYGDDAQTVLRLDLPFDWPAGGKLTLTAAYDVLIPQAAYRFGESGGIWMLAGAFLTPAPYVDGEYRTDDYYPIGDPFFTECRNYDVQLTVPQGYAVGGSAAAVPQSTADGRQTLRLTAPAARDFALCLSRDYHLAQAMVGGVLVSAYAKADASARAMLATASAALPVYVGLYGAYPYPALTLCEAAFPLQTQEYPGLSMVAGDVLQKGGDEAELSVARSIAHQWWYAAVGSDPYYDAWQDEAVCEFSLLSYWGARHGEAAQEALRFARAETPMRVTIPRGVTPGSPLSYFGDYSEYRVVVYGRGAAALCALDTAMGGRLNAFLRHYYKTFAYRIATRADFENLLASYTGEDWSPLLSDYLDTYLTN